MYAVPWLETDENSPRTNSRHWNEVVRNAVAAYEWRNRECGLSEHESGKRMMCISHRRQAPSIFGGNRTTLRNRRDSFLRRGCCSRGFYAQNELICGRYGSTSEADCSNFLWWECWLASALILFQCCDDLTLRTGSSQWVWMFVVFELCRFGSVTPSSASGWRRRGDGVVKTHSNEWKKVAVVVLYRKLGSSVLNKKNK